MPSTLDVLQIHPDDNVCVATRPLRNGAKITCGDVHFVLTQDVQLGAKLALLILTTGDKIFKFGEGIGSLIVDVPLGGYIHTHNLESDYLHTFKRGELINGKSIQGNDDR